MSLGPEAMSEVSRAGGHVRGLRYYGMGWPRYPVVLRDGGGPTHTVSVHRALRALLHTRSTRCATYGAVLGREGGGVYPGVYPGRPHQRSIRCTLADHISVVSGVSRAGGHNPVYLGPEAIIRCL